MLKKKQKLSNKKKASNNPLSRGLLIEGKLQNVIDDVFLSEEELRIIENHYQHQGKEMFLTSAFDPDRNEKYHYYSNSPWIQTYSGRRFNPSEACPDAILIEDIAHALSLQCRFTGHCAEFYSIAQHSVGVSYICGEEYALYGLLHDATEFALTDLSAPLKQSGLFDNYVEMEKKLMKAICIRFGLPQEEPASVKKADKVMLATENRDLMGPSHFDWNLPYPPLPFQIIPLSPRDAEKQFLARFTELTGTTPV